VYLVQLISTPFHPAFLTAERVANAKKLKLALTAGIGSDHIDLPSAAKAGITVAEITGGLSYLALVTTANFFVSPPPKQNVMGLK
jgi:lactate dehydrogenase-like 2-hydroxyacid dehydrogenase